MKITIEDLESYLSDRYSGWANETGMFMKLVEEMGEVAEILNMRAGRKASTEVDLQEELGIELADIIHQSREVDLENCLVGLVKDTLGDYLFVVS